ncbi:MAG: hypothetical protein ACKPJH_18570 [Dolichospermum sp.]
MRYIQYVETPEGSALLSRPVMEFPVPTKPDVPATTSVSQHTGRSIQLRAPSEWEQGSSNAQWDQSFIWFPFN